VGSLTGLAYGFSVALTPLNLLACFIGVLVGTIVGVLPGIGPVGAMALLIPITLSFDPTTAIIMMAGIFYGAMYGGSTTSILVNVPGEAASVVTCLDGYQMAQKGRAGAALTVAAVGSFVAGTLGLVGVQFFAPALADAALSFGTPEYSALAILGLVLLSSLGGGSAVKNYFMAALGVMLGTVGMEGMTGYSRYTFGRVELAQGIDIIPVAMGLFGIAEVLVLAEESLGITKVTKVKLRELLPTAQEWMRSFPPMLRGGVLGFVIGLVPGPAAVISTFASYALEKRISKHPEEFGHGAIEGVAGPESANNAASAAAMVPLLALGIPFAPAAAMLLGALMIHGIQPGPLLIQQRPDLFWGVVASMYIGNVMLLILNLPLVGLFTNLLRLPKHTLTLLIAILCLIGTFAVNNSTLDLFVLITMGGIGYALRKLRFDLAPIILGLILGPIIETRLIQSLIATQGDVFPLLRRPITATLLGAGLLAILLPPIIRTIRRIWSTRRASGAPAD
jgi:putative tricarboxylic transport membrane protein